MANHPQSHASTSTTRTTTNGDGILRASSVSPQPLAFAPPLRSSNASTSAPTSVLPSTSTPSTQIKKARRSKVAEACKFCRRSHMSCDAGRPCGRCVKREIAHLCIDEALSTNSSNSATGSGSNAPSAADTPTNNSSIGLQIDSNNPPNVFHQPELNERSSSTGSRAEILGSANSFGLGGMASSSVNSVSPAYNPSETVPQFGTTPRGIEDGIDFTPNNSNTNFNSGPMMGNNNFNMAMLDLAGDGLEANLGFDLTMENGEFQGLGLSEFLQSLNDSPFLTTESTRTELQSNTELGISAELSNTTTKKITAPGTSRSNANSVPGSPINKTEKFLLTAADQKDGSRSDRLARVIHAKFEAGLLRPYNHVAGYTRLMRWMADNMSQNSRQRTLHTLSEFRPAFRAIASGLTDLDLVFIEEAFERLLLDYDRVFSSMGIPSCLWRRTGEIYKGNKEFAALVGVPIEQLQSGKLAIYELMAEESAVNYWEQYSHIAFDTSQKAVLTSCVLINQQVLSRKRKKPGADKAKVREEAMINCCFSFTIRRDSYAIPSMIVGNFLKFG